MRKLKDGNTFTENLCLFDSLFFYWLYSLRIVKFQKSSNSFPYEENSSWDEVPKLSPICFLLVCNSFFFLLELLVFGGWILPNELLAYQFFNPERVDHLLIAVEYFA